MSEIKKYQTMLLLILHYLHNTYYKYLLQITIFFLLWSTMPCMYWYAKEKQKSYNFLGTFFKIKLRLTTMWHQITFFWIEKHTHKWECHHHTEKLSSHFASQKLVVLSAHWVVEYHFLISSNYNAIWYHSSEIPKMCIKWTKTTSNFRIFGTQFLILPSPFSLVPRVEKNQNSFIVLLTYHTTFDAIV